VAGSDGVTASKVSSTDPEFGIGVVGGLTEALALVDRSPSAVREIAHATTAGSNMVLGATGARTALVTTAGFRDVLEIGRLRIPVLYDLTWEKPAPIIPRRWRLTVPERLDHTGAVVMPLDETATRRVARRLRRDAVESVAVCLLHSYANPAHERRVAEILREELGDVPISLSSEILPEAGEFERSSTTAVNAYVKPMMARYLLDLSERLASIGVKAPLSVMQSGGGLLSATQAAERPVYVIESGPAAGVLAARQVAKRLSLDKVLTLDMGGTTAKAGLIEHGSIGWAPEYELGGGVSIVSRLLRGAGYLVRVPSIDVAEVGTGAGGIAAVDAGGSLTVGPRSAGSNPGPASYGKGGALPTVTDANLILGYLNPDGLAGGTLLLEVRLARAAIAGHVARPLGIGVTRSAWGTHLIANAGMMRALRAVSSERGRDIRTFSLVAFGGSGPVHAANLARSAGIGLVVVPVNAGLFSAQGLLEADPEIQQVQSVRTDLTVRTPLGMEHAFAKLERATRKLIADGAGSMDDVEISRMADLRYAGQAYALSVAAKSGTTVSELARLFSVEHKRAYGFLLDSEPVELMSLRVVARQKRSHARSLQAVGRADPRGHDHGPRRRKAYFGPAEGWVTTPIVSRGSVSSSPMRGPVIVEDYDSTTVVPPSFTVRRDAAGNLLIRVPVKE
jgi:N-methylhydantoinase A